MIYDIRHVTAYTYQTPVTYSLCALRLRPTSRPGQHVVDTSLIIDPPPARRWPRSCFFGNNLEIVRIETQHRKLRVEARSRVKVTRAPAPDFSPRWEDLRENAFASTDLGAHSPVHFIYPSRHILLNDKVSAYARASFPAGRPALEGAMDLMARIWKDFEYDPKATLVSTPLIDAFNKRRGVCQDFAHIMIASLRGVGLPAAYVSGYLRTVPPPGQPRLEGADATHAWVAFWCGKDHGWIGLDPTNNIVVGDDHIVLAEGRDYDDVSPLDGIILSSGGQDVNVGVDVIPVADEYAPATFADRK